MYSQKSQYVSVVLYDAVEWTVVKCSEGLGSAVKSGEVQWRVVKCSEEWWSAVNG